MRPEGADLMPWSDRILARVQAGAMGEERHSRIERSVVRIGIDGG